MRLTALGKRPSKATRLLTCADPTCAIVQRLGLSPLIIGGDAVVTVVIGCRPVRCHGSTHVGVCYRRLQVVDLGGYLVNAEVRLHDGGLRGVFVARVIGKAVFHHQCVHGNRIFVAQKLDMDISCSVIERNGLPGNQIRLEGAKIGICAVIGDRQAVCDCHFVADVALALCRKSDLTFKAKEARACVAHFDLD